MAVREPSLKTLCDLVVAATNAQFTLTATRQNCPTVPLETMATLQVVVVPATKALQQTNRDVSTRNYQVEIGLFQRIDPVEPHEDALSEDAVLALGEEILDWWVDTEQGVNYSGGGDDIPIYCTAGRLANDEPFSIDVRRKDNVIRVIIQLDFKVV